jgi:hypothetical protein
MSVSLRSKGSVTFSSVCVIEKAPALKIRQAWAHSVSLLGQAGLTKWEVQTQRLHTRSLNGSTRPP